MKHRYRKKVVLVFFVVAVLLIAGGAAWLWMKKTLTIRDVTAYGKYFGRDGEHRRNSLIVNDIFPEKLPESAVVEKFCYQRTDLIDLCDTAVLVYTCDAEDYDDEIARLAQMETTEECAYGVYGITGFPYEVCAVVADDYYGIVYAMTEEAEHRIIYVENTHCNYFSDHDYEEVIGAEYLPFGYDATRNNPVRAHFEETGGDTETNRQSDI